MINETSSYNIGENNLAEQGITFNESFATEDNSLCGIIHIRPRLENNNTKLQCIANVLDAAPLVSAAVMFKVQGKKPSNALLLNAFY